MSKTLRQVSSLDRRKFLTCSAGLAAAMPAEARVVRESGVRLKLGLNAYSFDKPLRDGGMTLDDAIHFCAQHNVDALDATGYYFPGYPKVPPDDYTYELKRTAFVNGVAISGTGVRNDFAVADAAARRKDVQMVKDWIVAASKLGSAGDSRIFRQGAPGGTQLRRGVSVDGNGFQRMRGVWQRARRGGSDPAA